MTHLFGIQIKADKKLWGALTDIPGLGLSGVQELIRHLGLNPNSTWRQLRKDQKQSLETYLSSQIKKGRFKGLGKDFLRQRNLEDSQYLSLGTNRGIRRRWGYPVRGQNTHSNARTAKILRKLPKTKRK